MTNPRLLSLILVSFIIICMNSNQMVDFTYSQLTAFKSGQINHPKISIFPDQSIFNNYDFPEACEIHTYLNQLQGGVQGKLQRPNIDQYLGQLKQKFKDLLQTSQKIKNLQKFIKSLPEVKQDRNLAISDEQLALLLDKQTELVKIQNVINNKTNILKTLVTQTMSKDQNPLFRQASLKFQQKSLQEKIKLLNKLLEQTGQSGNSQQQSSSKEPIEEYFSKLKDFFQGEGTLLNDLLQLLQNYNQLSMIKSKISNLNTQIETHNLIIAQKEQCRAERQLIRRTQNNHHDILELMRTLKQKKSVQQTNQYCQGVVKKLIDRVSKLLASYDVVFMCAQGIDGLISNRTKFQEQLKLAQQKLKELQDRQGIDQFQKRYNQNRQQINRKISQISHFKLKQFSQSPLQIQKTINQTKKKLELTNQQLQKLEQPSHKVDRSQLFAKIQGLIVQLKILKNQHCSLQSQYEQNSKKIYQKLYGLEQQTQYNLNIEQIHFQKINDLRRAQTKLKTIQEELMQMLKK